MKILEYVMKIRDFASSPMAKLANSIRQATAAVNTIKNRFQDFTQKAGTFTERLIGRNKILSASYKSIQTAIKRVGSAASSFKMPSLFSGASSKGGGFSVSGILGKFKGILGTVGSVINPIIGAVGSAVESAVGPIMSLGKDAVNKSLERQKTQTSFNILAGNKDAGGKLMADLVQLRKETILGPEIFQNAQTMMGHGMKADDVVPNMKMLGDVSMGDPEKLNTLALAFSQVQASGKMMSQDLMQFTSAGFNPLLAMSERTGKSIEQLNKEVEGGKISFADVQQSLIDSTSEGGRFANVMEQIAETPAGKLKNIENAWDEIKVKAGDAFMPVISMALDLANSILPLIESAIEPMASGIMVVAEWMSEIKNSSGGFMDYVKIASTYYEEHVIPLFIKLYQVISDIVIKILNFVKNSELLKDVFSFVYLILGAVIDSISAMVDGLKKLFDTVVMPILDRVEKGYRYVKKFFTGKDIPTKDDPNATPPNATPPKEDKAKSFLDKLLEKLNKNKDKSNATKTLNETAKHAANNSNNSQKAKDDIISGKQQVVNIHVGKFLDSINLNSINLQEGTAEIEKTFMELFARVLVGTTNDALS